MITLRVTLHKDQIAENGQGPTPHIFQEGGRGIKIK